MTDIQETSNAPVILTPAPRRRSPLGRLGCGIALVVWFFLLLTPCMLILLATQNEITIPLGGDAPDHEIRLWLIQEIDERGLGISTTSILQTEPDALCVQTRSRFMLWQGEAEPIAYCECYTRSAADAEWTYSSMKGEACGE